jgi:hypothetical protein
MTAMIAFHDPTLHEDFAAEGKADRIGLAVHRFGQ